MKRVQFTKLFERSIEKLDIALQDRLYNSIFDYSFLHVSEYLKTFSEFQKFRLSRFRVIFFEDEEKYLFIDIMDRKKEYNIKEIYKWRKYLESQKKGNGETKYNLTQI